MFDEHITLYNSQQIRRCEHNAIAKWHITAESLMARAGKSAFTSIKELYPDAKCLAVFCGGGNNGGDGYVVARLAHQDGYQVSIYEAKPPEELSGAAQAAAQKAHAAGIACHPLGESLDNETDLIIDALLGIGLENQVHGSIADAIDQINLSGLPVAAIDVPSGLHADTGHVLGICVHAHTTITFIALKQGLYMADAPDYCGRIICHDLDLHACLAECPPSSYLLSESLLKDDYLAPRLKNSHKGMFGHVLIIGGGKGMPGATYLAANAALRIGAGKVSIATSTEHATHVLPNLPEAIVYGIDNPSDLTPLLSQATVCIIGPGLGQDDWARTLFSKTIATQLPLIIDASALRILADDPQHDDHWILTPHPGEAACLLQCKTEDVQLDRYTAINRIQQQYGGHIILKGSGTMVHTAQQGIYTCPAGNPGMASAGMGDVLSGVIGGLLAQGASLSQAAKLGVWLHAKAGDDLARKYGQRGMLASDLMPYLRQRVNY